MPCKNPIKVIHRPTRAPRDISFLFSNEPVQRRGLRPNTEFEGDTLQRIPAFRTLDALRGLAAIWVVTRHSAATFAAGTNARFAHEPLYFVALRGQLGVMLFFVISGYCIMAAAYAALINGKPVQRYAYERFRRIYPPYLAALVITVLTVVLANYASAHHWIGSINHPRWIGSSFTYWAGNLFLLQSELNVEPANGVFWSLCYEVAFYAVVGVMLWVAKLVAARHGAGAATLTLLMGVTITTSLSLLSLIATGSAVFPFDLWHMFSLGSILFFLVEAGPGTVSGYSRRFRWIVNSVAVFVLALIAVYVALHPNDDTDTADPHSRIRSAATMLFFLLLMALRPFDQRLGRSRWMRPLLWLGACSYSIYLIHTVVLPFASVITRKAGLDGNLYWISFWIQVGAAILFGRLFYYLIERHFVSSRQKKRLVEEHAG
jgi:peptidoglycan/LPS O-acetylase OafA/YrhL